LQFVCPVTDCLVYRPSDQTWGFSPHPVAGFIKVRLDREIPATEHFVLNSAGDVAGTGNHPPHTLEVTLIRSSHITSRSSCIRELDPSNGAIKRGALMQHLAMQATLVGEPLRSKHQIGCSVTFDIKMGLDPVNH
jgi:hypothetical protein